MYIDGYLHDVHEAEELMLDVFRHICSPKSRSIRDGGFKAYLYKAARHMALRRKSRRKRLFSLDTICQTRRTGGCWRRRSYGLRSETACCTSAWVK